MNRDALATAIKRVVLEIDYDTYKYIELPEDPEYATTWDDLVEVFMETYDIAVRHSE